MTLDKEPKPTRTKKPRTRTIRISEKAYQVFRKRAFKEKSKIIRVVDQLAGV